jgi:hypothetical protein
MIYAAFVLWLWRGGDRMSTQPTDLPANDFPPRTIEDVEQEMRLANSLIMEHRERMGPVTNILEIRDGKPALLTQEINWLHEEWRVMWDAARD